MKDTTDDILRRAKRYWYVDGLVEMSGGFVIFVLGLWTLVLRILPAQVSDSWIGAVAQFGLIIVLLVISRFIVNQLKERWTYRRTGYVSYQQPRPLRRVAKALATAGFAAVGAAAILIVGETLPKSFVPITAGTIFAMLSAWLGAQYGLKRFYFVAASALLIGIMAALLPLPDKSDSAFVLIGFGLSWLASGGFTLYHYLRKTQPAEGDDL